MAEKYDPAEIDPKWQRRWEEERVAYVDTAAPGDKFYMLNMFPYPSGSRLHVGHGRNYILGDALYRRERMAGRRTLNPMGWDAFGLPAENAAIASGVHPREYTEGNIARMKTQLKSLGLLYDWSKELASCDPRYYRWNQWLFLRMWERGLAYRKTAPVNWCPGCRTVLANEQVVDGRCERSGDPVEIRDLTQWFFRITDYAERLLAGLDGLDWPDRVKTMQRNWIGRSEGAEIFFRVDGLAEPVPVFTTRPDTLFGATFLALAPEHPAAAALAERSPRRADIEPFIERVRRESRLERESEGGEKEGIDTGFTALNPATGETIPVWLANFVLPDYGTGAIMGVPAHDQRDFEFARKYGLPIRPVYRSDEGDIDPAAMIAAAPHGGVLVRSGRLGRNAERTGGGDEGDRLDRGARARQGPRGLPPPRLADLPAALLGDADSRGPLPDLRRGAGARRGPARAPSGGRRVPRRRGQPPRAVGGVRVDPVSRLRRAGAARNRHHGHLRGLLLVLPPVPEPGRHDTDGGPAARGATGCPSTSTSADRARDPPPPLRPVHLPGPEGPRPRRDRGAVRAPLQPGNDHEAEPGDGQDREDVEVARQHGLARRAHRPVRRRHGARVHAVHRASREGIGVVGGGRRGGVAVSPARARPVRPRRGKRADAAGAGSDAAATPLLRIEHRTIQRVTEDAARFHFHTAVAALMEFQRAIADAADAGSETAGSIRRAAETLLKLLHPIAPHLTEEWWERLGNRFFLVDVAWPEFDPALATSERITLVVQVNGKVRGRLDVERGAAESDALALARADEKIRPWVEGKEIARAVYVPDRLLNLVVR